MIKVIHSGVGLINESDVSLAMASDALLIAFNTSATKEAKEKARSNKLNVSSFQIIYELIEYVSDFATGKLKPKFEENYLGRAEILKVFKVSKIGSIAGCIVSDGVVDKKAKAKVIERNQQPSINNLIYRGSIYTHSQKLVVKKYFKNMTFFFLTIPFLILFSMFISVFTMNFYKFIYNYGRLRGFFKIDFN